MRPLSGEAEATAFEKARAASGLARRYLAAAIANPRLAVRRAKEIIHGQAVRLVPKRQMPKWPGQFLAGIGWNNAIMIQGVNPCAS